MGGDKTVFANYFFRRTLHLLKLVKRFVCPEAVCNMREKRSMKRYINRTPYLIFYHILYCISNVAEKRHKIFIIINSRADLLDIFKE